MIIFVISLRQSVERRAHISAHLSKLGLEFEWIDAVDGRTLSRSDLARVYNDRWARRHLGRSLKPGELGCALSHVDVYRQIVTREIPVALVLEDDALLDAEVVAWLKTIEAWIRPSDPHIVLLSEVAEKGIPPNQAAAMFGVRSVRSAAYLAHAYVITQESARKLGKLLFPVVQVADDWSWVSRNAKVILYASSTTLGLVAPSVGLKSTIGLRPSPAAPATGKLRSLRRRIYRKFWQAAERYRLGYLFWSAK